MSEQLGQPLPSSSTPQLPEQATPSPCEGATDPSERTIDETPPSVSNDVPPAVVRGGDSLPLDRDPSKPVKFGLKMSFKKK